MERQESIARLLLAQRETTWDALKQWTEDLNKLIYWLALLCAAATAASLQTMPLALTTLVAALPVWLYMYLRGSYWYGVNMTVLAHVERRLNSSVAEQGATEVRSPLLVQARAGCDGHMSLTGPLRAPWLAFGGTILTLVYFLFAGLRIEDADWQGDPQVRFLIFGFLMAIGTALEFLLFCKYKLPKLKKLRHELVHGFEIQEMDTHNTAAQADSYAAA